LTGVFLIACLEIRIHRLENALKAERMYSRNLETQLAIRLELENAGNA
jgi:hypothetical protein